MTKQLLMSNFELLIPLSTLTTNYELLITNALTPTIIKTSNCESRTTNHESSTEPIQGTANYEFRTANPQLVTTRINVNRKFLTNSTIFMQLGITNYEFQSSIFSICDVALVTSKLLFKVDNHRRCWN